MIHNANTQHHLPADIRLETVAPFHFFSRSYQTSYKNLLSLVRVVAIDIFQAAVANGLEITGPQHWHYDGADGHPNTIFTLEIGVPVAAVKQVAPPYTCKTLPPFHCLGKSLHGTWLQLSDVYTSLINNAHQAGLQLNGQQRETYIQCNFDNPDAHITYIQVGLQA
ncbi:GyrI-like domain-containing protein [Chitinophaga pendula]|uniref:GyrI-like domain-containing protein n=1 Tax=Chitinophaga TaxID=79328 RepID=UPI000BAE7DC5|nr:MULTISPECIES: GyrI-like domain-containing protein [Chitinophaga]ASZ09957.1 hypothetical protein CK934_02665 [Chitinophaga sp. MD30]UCJ07101.1 GyrI-like domain-containing protein [Chitinophaga pendula]